MASKAERLAKKQASILARELKKAGRHLKAGGGVKTISLPIIKAKETIGNPGKVSATFSGKNAKVDLAGPLSRSAFRKAKQQIKEETKEPIQAVEKPKENDISDIISKYNALYHHYLQEFVSYSATRTSEYLNAILSMVPNITSFSDFEFAASFFESQVASGIYISLPYSISGADGREAFIPSMMDSENDFRNELEGL